VGSTCRKERGEINKWKPVLSGARTVKRISDGHYLQVLEVKND